MMLHLWGTAELSEKLSAMRQLHDRGVYASLAGPQWNAGDRWFIMGIPKRFLTRASALAHLEALEEALVLKTMTED